MEGIIGYTTLFAGTFAPNNWAFCAGQILPISQNTALFSILGTMYGGNGTTNFALPNLIGRSVVSVGQSQGSELTNYSLGEIAGGESMTLKMEHVPQHTHPVTTTIIPSAATDVNSPSPKDAVYGQGSETLFNPTADSTFQHFNGNITMGPNPGGPAPFSTLHPVMALNYIICLRGAFPQRP